MKKILLVTFLAISFAFVGMGLAQTQAACSGSTSDVLCNGGANSPCSNPDATNTPVICNDNSTGSKTNPLTGSSGILTQVTSIVLYVVGIAAVIMVIVSGIRMATSNGDPQAFSSARTGLIYALIGLVIAVLARVIVLFIIGRI
jgi:hypothetical protein